MADATRRITAAEDALDRPEGSFLAAYRANRTKSRRLTLEASPLAAPLKQLLATADWTGTATTLLTELEGRVGDMAVKRRDWPRSAQQVGTELRRLAPDLRRVEQIEIVFSRLGSCRAISVIRRRDLLSKPSRPSLEKYPED